MKNESWQAACCAFQQRLLSVWPTHETALLQALDAGMRERRDSLSKLLADRAAKEVADMWAILTELRTLILNGLDVPEVEQLQLCSDPEREQWERNIDSLRARANQIPQEIEQETAAITSRFAAPQVHIFPVAVDVPCARTPSP